MKRIPDFLCLVFLGACASSSRPKNGPQASEFFRRDFENSLRAVLRESEHDGLLRGFPTLVALGDAEPLHFRRARQGAELAPFDRADRAPWWWDVARAEAGAIVLASERSLKDYREGACLESYGRTLGELGSLLGSDAAPPATTPLAAAVGEAPPTSPAPTPGAPPDSPVSASLVNAFARVLPEGVTVASVRRLEEGNYLATTSDARTLEFRRLAPQAFEWPAGGEAWKSGCERYLKAGRLYAPGAEFKCLFTGGNAYAVEFRAETRTPVAEDVKDAAALGAHLRWMCRELAMAHARQSETARVREIHLSLREGKPLGARLLNLARREAARSLEAWRASLK